MIYPIVPKYKVEERRRRRYQQQLRRNFARISEKDTKVFAHRIQQKLKQLRYYNLLRHSNPDVIDRLMGEKKEQLVEFIRMEYDEDSIWLQVDSMNMPIGVRADDIADEQTLEELSRVCQREVVWHDSLDGGQWLEIVRNGSRAGIPDHVGFAEAFQQLGTTTPGTLIPIGLARGRNFINADLNKLYNLLIAGVPGSGKSNAINVILSTLIARNTPDQLHLALCDLKGGIEFSFYEGVPHVRQLVSETQQVESLIEELLYEVERRQTLIKNAGVKNIVGYNYINRHRPGDQLPTFLALFDEFGDLMLSTDRQAKKIATAGLARVLQRGRAVGVRLILCTQTPNSDVIDKSIKHNLPNVLALNCANLQHSMVVVGNGDAAGPGMANAGRGIFIYNGIRTRLQIPEITDKQIREAADYATRDEVLTIDEGNPVSLDEILLYSIDNLGRSLAERALFAEFRGRITKSALRVELRDLDNQEIEIDGIAYRVIPGSGSAPRHLIPLSYEEDNTQEDGNNEY